MCCGSRRSAWRAAQAPTLTTSASPPVRRAATGETPVPGVTMARGPFPLVTLSYEAAVPIRVRGPVTGRLYAFSERAPSQAVDLRDAVVLTRNRAFRRTAL